MRISQRVRRAAIAGAVAILAAAVLAQPAAAVVGSAATRQTPSFNGSVYAIAYRGDTVYVGGSFTSTVIGGRTVTRNRLAAFDATSGALRDWAPDADGTVRALAVAGDSIYAGGDFDEVDGADRDALARIDADSGEVGAFAHGVEGSVQTLAVGGDRLYAGGTISQVDGESRRRLAAFSLSTGRLDDDWTPAADNTVNALAYHDGQVYLGGSFHRTDDVRNTLRLSRVGATDGAVDEDFRPAPPAVVRALAVDATGVYVALGGEGGRAVAYTASGTRRWVRAFDGDAQAIAVLNGTAYVGGHFDRACRTGDNGVDGECGHDSVSRVKLAAIDGDGSLSDWDPHANGIVGVRTIVVDRPRGTVAAGGDFTSVGGRTQRRFAAFG